VGACHTGFFRCYQGVVEGLGDSEKNQPHSSEGVEDLFYEINFSLMKNGICPDDMELDEVLWVLKKINEEVMKEGE
ncbi:MAG TPA: hypothetical protein PLV22_06235, partial [Candidatus Cloacimonadota bacterium]|nr:hypothetical protein [Candidatus Cloacimonadota bacterium]